MPGFTTSTRRRVIRLPAMTRPGAGGGTTQISLPKTGILAALYLDIRGTIAGAPGAVNPLGHASIINRVQVTVNSGIDLYNITGPGYHWLMRDFVDLYRDPVPQSTGRNIVAGAGEAFDVSMVLPIALNNRDEAGLIMLQNEMTLVTVTIDWAADTIVSATSTIGTPNANVIMEYFEVPADPKNWPSFDVVHAVLEDRQVIGGAGDFTYQWPRGNVYTGVYHLVETTTWTQAQVRAQQGNILFNDDPASHGLYLSRILGRTPVLAGGAVTGNNRRVLWDLMGTDGLGAYGSERDMIDSARLTDLASVITVAAAGALRTVRRQLIPLGA